MREHSEVSGALSGREQCHRPSGPVCRPPHGRILTFSPGWDFPTEPEQGFPLAHHGLFQSGPSCIHSFHLIELPEAQHTPVASLVVRRMGLEVRTT